MRRRNHRTKAAETLKKTDPQFGFTFPDPSTSRAHLDLKRRRKVTFVDVDDRSPLNDSSEGQTGQSLDAKTSEFAFFKKLKSDFGLCSESSDSRSSSFQVKQNSKKLESRSKPGAKVQTVLECAGTDREAKDGCKGYSFSTPNHTTRGGSCVSSISHVNLTQRDKEKDSGKCSSALRRDEDVVRSGNNLRSGGISDEKGDIFSVKRKKLHQWVKDTWSPEIAELSSNGHDLVSVLLTRLFPGKEDTHPSRFSKDRTDRRKRRTFLDSPGSKFSHESYTEVDHNLQMETDRDRSISLRGFLGNSIVPNLQFPTGHVHSSFTPRDLEEISYSISYPERSLYRPSLLKQRTSMLFPLEDALDWSPVSSVHFRNYEPLSLDYHREESGGYSSENLSHDHKERSSALLLEWNSETASTRKTDDFPHTKLITYPSASSSSLANDPWSSDYSSSHDLITRELHPLPLISNYTSDSFLLPETRPTSYFEHELERHLTDDKDVVAENLNLQTFHHTNNSDCLTRDYTYYHNLSNSAMDHGPSKVSECEIVSSPISSFSNRNLLEALSPLKTERFKSHHWRSFQLQSSEAWIDL